MLGVHKKIAPIFNTSSASIENGSSKLLEGKKAMRCFVFASVGYSILLVTGWSAEVTLRNNRISFSTPDDFTELTQEQISLKFPRSNPPSKAYANNDMGVSISIIFSPASVAPSQLEELKVLLEQTLPRLIPNLVWKKREIIERNGIRWVHFEILSSAINADIYNNMYMTSFDGKMLAFNFNSTKKQYPEFSHSLMKSFESIKIENSSSNRARNAGF